MGNSGHLVFLALSKLFFTGIQFHLSSFSTFLDMKMQTELYPVQNQDLNPLAFKLGQVSGDGKIGGMAQMCHF